MKTLSDQQATRERLIMAWQPIATAPKDSRILVFTGQEIYAANWVKNIENDHEAWMVGYMTNGDGLVVSAILWHDAPDEPLRALARPA